MSQEALSLNIREFLFVLKKHCVLLFILPLIFGLAGYGICQWLIVPQYQSDAILIINASPSSTVSASITYDQITTAQQLVETYAIILKSDTVLDQVIKALDLSTNAKKLAEKIKIAGINGTEVLDISVLDPDAQTAANIANEIIKVAPDVIISTVNAGSVKVVSKAKKEDMPASPDKKIYVAASLAAGLLLAIIVSLLRETFNNTFTSGRDVEESLGYPVLGVIPDIKKRQYGSSNPLT